MEAASSANQLAERGRGDEALRRLHGSGGGLELRAERSSTCPLSRRAHMGHNEVDEVDKEGVSGWL